MSHAPLETVLDRIDADLDPALDRLMALLRIPSVSTDPAYAQHCQDAADWLVADLQSMGVTAEKHETPGHPMVMGKIAGAPGHRGPHLLFYGHYDVQPVDPLALWDRDPFDPQLEDTDLGKVIRGRGTADDKGQLMTFVEACRAWIAVNGALPCDVTFLFEGEEESGSPSLVPYMEAHKDDLRADLALICDTGLFESKTPGIVTMLRGLMGEEVTICAPDKDLHSGMYGGVSMNPIRVLTQALASLHDAEGRVTLPGFYDGVPELPDAIRQQWQGLAFDHAAFLGGVGLSQPAGETDRTPLEQIWSRPTAEVNGIWGGYTGEGFKTVLPAEAHAKVSFRLVGDQDPHTIRSTFRQAITDMLPPDCTATFKEHGSGRASITATDNPAFEAARHALSEEWQVPAAYIGCGGSIPIAGHFQNIVDTTPMLIGFGKDNDQMHSPNEKYDLESFHKGIRSWARILDALT